MPNIVGGPISRAPLRPTRLGGERREGAARKRRAGAEGGRRAGAEISKAAAPDAAKTAKIPSKPKLVSALSSPAPAEKPRSSSSRAKPDALDQWVNTLPSAPPEAAGEFPHGPGAT